MNLKNISMKQKVMIDNQSGFQMEMVMAYLIGFTTTLNGCIEVITEPGVYYDNIIIKSIV
jgi:hypothetical protein